MSASQTDRSTPQSPHNPACAEAKQLLQSAGYIAQISSHAMSAQDQSVPSRRIVVASVSAKQDCEQVEFGSPQPLTQSSSSPQAVSLMLPGLTHQQPCTKLAVGVQVKLSRVSPHRAAHCEVTSSPLSGSQLTKVS